MEQLSNLHIKSKSVSMLLALAMGLLSPLVFAAQDSPTATLQQTSKAFASIAKEVSPAVVNIQSDGLEGQDAAEQGQEYEDIPPQFLEFFRNFDPNGMYRRPPVMRQGSGFIITKDGYIVTNNHLVQGAAKITVRTMDDKEYIARIIGTDPQSDIAVIKIDAKNLPAVRLGNSDQTEVGEWVVAVGNPFGLSHSISAGILSAKGRSSVGLADYENFLQTDAAINPGNSGGPLIDLDGSVIGINTAIFSRSGGYMGIGFAIPINMAKGIIDQLIDKGNVVRGYLGVKIQPMTNDLAASFGLSSNKGILVAQVEPDSPAAKSGLQQGDVIVALDNISVTNIGEFRNSIASMLPNSKHTLQIMRANKAMSLEVAVGKLPTQSTVDKGGNASQPLTLANIGVSVQNITADIASKLGIKPGIGVIVSSVKPGSLAEQAGLSRGVIILEVNRVKVNDVNQLQSEIAKATKDKRVLLLVQDQFGSRFIAFNII